MSKTYSQGSKVRWDWGDGTASGTVKKKYTRKVTRTIKGTEVTREADEDCPAYLIEQSDGDEVLKSHSEVRAA